MPWNDFEQFKMHLACMPYLRYLAIQTPVVPFPCPEGINNQAVFIKQFLAWDFLSFANDAEIMRDKCTAVCPSLRQFYPCFGYWKDLHTQYPSSKDINEDKIMEPDLDQFQFYFCNTGLKDEPAWVKEKLEMSENAYKLEGGRSVFLSPIGYDDFDQFTYSQHYGQHMDPDLYIAHSSYDFYDIPPVVDSDDVLHKGCIDWWYFINHSPVKMIFKEK